ncbi:Hypothetical predicted protein [Podarcis lilfordi]|uniref:Uncharacterized protein n=1 Tax=Podarcis lilfordi TaxID=74358 RepID=A0AA35PPF4_9SAUR|nr:Hypothetical predicted protein [Podarcis lilfordi]
MQGRLSPSGSPGRCKELVRRGSGLHECPARRGTLGIPCQEEQVFHGETLMRGWRVGLVAAMPSCSSEDSMLLHRQ